MTNSLPELEQEIIGVCLTTTGAIRQVATMLPRAEAMQTPENRTVYAQMLALCADGKETDLVTLNYHLTRAQGPLTPYNQPWMVLLTSYIPAAKRAGGNLLHKCGLLHQEYIRVALSNELSRALVEAQDVTSDPLALIDSLRGWLEKTSNRLSELSEKPFSDALKNVVDRAELASQNRNPITGISTGLFGLDGYTKGLQPGTLTVLAARPSMGKSAEACQIAYNVAYVNKIAVAFFSLEMSKESLAGRMLAIDTGIRNSHVTAGVDSFGDPINIERLRDSEQRQGKAPFFIYDKLRTLPQIKARVSQLSSRYGGQLLVIIDYLQLVKTGTKIDTDITARVSEVSRELKEIAITYSIPVLALGQLNREVEKRADKRPQLSDLNHSGSIEQDADTVGFLFRPGYYSANDKDGYPVDMNLLINIIAKNRNGSTHKDDEGIKLHYDLATNQIKDYAVQ